jgi:hypothetical protein
MIATSAPDDNSKAPFEEPAAPASSESWGLSEPPLYPAGGSSLPTLESWARERRGSSSEKKRARLMLADDGAVEEGLRCADVE